MNVAPLRRLKDTHERPAFAASEYAGATITVAVLGTGFLDAIIGWSNLGAAGVVHGAPDLGAGLAPTPMVVAVGDKVAGSTREVTPAGVPLRAHLGRATMLVAPGSSCANGICRAGIPIGAQNRLAPS